MHLQHFPRKFWNFVHSPHLHGVAPFHRPPQPQTRLPHAENLPGAQEKHGAEERSRHLRRHNLQQALRIDNLTIGRESTRGNKVCWTILAMKKKYKFDVSRREGKKKRDELFSR